MDIKLFSHMCITILGKDNPLAGYSIGGTALDRTKDEKDLGVLIAVDCKMNK